MTEINGRSVSTSRSAAARMCVPIAAVLMRPELDVLEPFDHSFTGGGNLLGLAAAEATLDIVAQDEFLADVRQRGTYLGELLSRLAGKQPRIGRVRGLGMMWGLEIVDDAGRPDPAMTQKIVTTARERHRLITRSSEYRHGHVVKVRPGLIATEQDLREIVDRLDASIRDAKGTGHARPRL